MATVKVLSAGAVQPMVTEIGAEFQRTSGHWLDLNFGTAGALRARFLADEVADLIALPQAMMAALDKLGLFLPDTRIDLGRTVTGIVVHEDAPNPDISTPEAMRQTLLAARSVSFSEPRAGGSSGTYMAELLQKLGIAEVVLPKAVYGNRGYEVAQAVADGRAEIGSTFISEILTVKGVRVVGPLPGDLYHANTYAAAVPKCAAQPEASRALLCALTDPATRLRWTAAGLEPAFP